MKASDRLFVEAANSWRSPYLQRAFFFSVELHALNMLAVVAVGIPQLFRIVILF